ncbi:MAG: hypothetical protein ACI94Z_001819, partial [Yoonia sp.]
KVKYKPYFSLALNFCIIQFGAGKLRIVVYLSFNYTRKYP